MHDCSSVNWTAPCPPSCQPREPGPQTRAQRRLVHRPFFSSPVSWGIEIGLFQLCFCCCCYCIILFIFNEVTLLNLTLFSYNFYTWPIVMFCLFVKSLYERNGTKINSCVTFECRWPVNILVPLSLSPCSLSQLIDAGSPVWNVNTLQKHGRLCIVL